MIQKQLAALAMAVIVGACAAPKTSVAPPAAPTAPVALYRAVIDGDTATVEGLLAGGACVMTLDKDECTPLHWAAMYNRVKIAELLIAKGADLNAKNSKGETPLQLAHEKHFDDIAALLVEHGANE